MNETIVQNVTKFCEGNNNNMGIYLDEKKDKLHV